MATSGANGSRLVIRTFVFCAATCSAAASCSAWAACSAAAAPARCARGAGPSSSSCAAGFMKNSAMPPSHQARHDRQRHDQEGPVPLGRSLLGRLPGERHRRPGARGRPLEDLLTHWTHPSWPRSSPSWSRSSQAFALGSVKTLAPIVAVRSSSDSPLRARTRADRHVRHRGRPASSTPARAGSCAAGRSVPQAEMFRLTDWTLGPAGLEVLGPGAPTRARRGHPRRLSPWTRRTQRPRPGRRRGRDGLRDRGGPSGRDGCHHHVGLLATVGQVADQGRQGHGGGHPLPDLGEDRLLGRQLLALLLEQGDP